MPDCHLCRIECLRISRMQEEILLGKYAWDAAMCCTALGVILGGRIARFRV